MPRRVLVAEAAAALVLARVAVLVMPFRAAARALGLRRGAPAPAVDAVAAARADRVGQAVLAAAARLPWHSSCLVQALAATLLLRLRRIDATLYLGVARTPSDPATPVAAHAWVRCGDVLLTGHPGERAWTPIATFVLGTRA